MMRRYLGLRRPKVMIIFHDGRREPRTIRTAGEACLARAIENLPDTAKRILPHGRVGDDGPVYVAGWEPLDPIEWQPPKAETSHEKIRRLEVELYRTRERLRSHERLLQSIARASKEALSG
mgnify:CR=1 FL=1